MIRRCLAVVVLALATVACAAAPRSSNGRIDGLPTTVPSIVEQAEPSATRPATTVTPATDTSPVEVERLDYGDLPPFDVSRIRLGERELTVVVAVQPGDRATGLQEVEEFGDFDGMLFVLPGEQVVRFTMRNTLVALDLALFDARGRMVELIPMIPCEEAPCPGYSSSQPVRWALETPAGLLGDVEIGTLLLGE